MIVVERAHTVTGIKEKERKKRLPGSPIKQKIIGYAHELPLEK